MLQHSRRVVVRLKGLVPATLRANPRCRIVRSYGFGSHMNDNDAVEIEKMKERSLKGTVVSHDPATPGWCEGLASDSEAVVKAERDPPMPMPEMRSFTVTVIKEEAEQDMLDATGGTAKPKGAMA